MAGFETLDFSISFGPTSAFPLDGRTYFDSKEAADAAAAIAEEVGSTNTKYYYGMILTVCEEGDISLWTIMPNKTLVRLTLSVTMDQTTYDQLAASNATNPGILYLIAGDVS